MKGRVLWLALLVTSSLAAAARAQEISLVPVTVDGETARLAMRIQKTVASGPTPTLVFNHGSTGGGRDPSLFARPIDAPAFAQFFVQRGWAMVMPARLGRGGSEGQYDEGFAGDRAAAYACDESLSIPGADRALREIEPAMSAILAMPFVDPGRVVIGGQWREGILSVAYAGRRPEQVKGVINFVGGWLGARCHVASAVNQALFTRGARYPREMLWLYGDQDPFYPLTHSRDNFAAFTKAGGKGTFHEFPPPAGSNGHRIVGFPDPWAPIVEAYLRSVAGGF